MEIPEMWALQSEDAIDLVLPFLFQETLYLLITIPEGMPNLLMKLKIRLLTHVAHLLSPYMIGEIHRTNALQLGSICKSINGTVCDLHIEGIQYITIGEHFHVGKHFRLCAIDDYSSEQFAPKIEIGDNVSFEDYCHLGCIEHLQIGNGCMFASKIFIEDHYHGEASDVDIRITPAERKLVSMPVIIGNNVLVGDGVCILPGVTLGDNVIIGANAVVTHSFPSNSVIAGVPAKLIRMLNG